MPQKEKSNLSGLVLRDGYALADTGAQFAVSGLAAFAAHQQQLLCDKDCHGKRMEPPPAIGPKNTSGIGGSARVLSFWNMLYGPSVQASGVVKLRVVDKDACPMLCPISRCYKLEMVLDTPNNVAYWSHYCTQSRITVEPSGQR